MVRYVSVPLQAINEFPWVDLKFTEMIFMMMITFEISWFGWTIGKCGLMHSELAQLHIHHQFLRSPSQV